MFSLFVWNAKYFSNVGLNDDEEQRLVMCNNTLLFLWILAKHCCSVCVFAGMCINQLLRWKVYISSSCADSHGKENQRLTQKMANILQHKRSLQKFLTTWNIRRSKINSILSSLVRLCYYTLYGLLFFKIIAYSFESASHSKTVFPILLRNEWSVENSLFYSSNPFNMQIVESFNEHTSVYAIKDNVGAIDNCPV